jgi:hypothetical protein
MLAKILNNTVAKYPFTLVDLEQENPYTKYEMNVDLIDIYPKTETGTRENSYLVNVAISTPPTFNPATHKIVESNPILNGNQWIQNWDIQQLTEEEKQELTSEKSSEFRKIRNELLADTDWTQLKDVPETVSQQYATYRQQLRDIPQQPDFPWVITWPEPIE